MNCEPSLERTDGVVLTELEFTGPVGKYILLKLHVYPLTFSPDSTRSEFSVGKNRMRLKSSSVQSVVWISQLQVQGQEKLLFWSFKVGHMNLLIFGWVGYLSSKNLQIMAPKLHQNVFIFRWYRCLQNQTFLLCCTLKKITLYNTVYF